MVEQYWSFLCLAYQRCHYTTVKLSSCTLPLLYVELSWISFKEKFHRVAMGVKKLGRYVREHLAMHFNGELLEVGATHVATQCPLTVCIKLSLTACIFLARAAPVFLLPSRATRFWWTLLASRSGLPSRAA